MPVFVSARDLTDKEVNTVNSVIEDVQKCQAIAKALEDEAGNFEKFIRQNEIPNLESLRDNELSGGAFDAKRHAKTWRDVKNRLKKAISDYDSKCSKITGKLKKLPEP